MKCCDGIQISGLDTMSPSEIIIEKISENGPISFHDFMGMGL